MSALGHELSLNTARALPVTNGLAEFGSPQPALPQESNNDAPDVARYTGIGHLLGELVTDTKGAVREVVRYAAAAGALAAIGGVTCAMAEFKRTPKWEAAKKVEQDARAKYFESGTAEDGRAFQDAIWAKVRVENEIVTGSDDSEAAEA